MMHNCRGETRLTQFSYTVCSEIIIQLVNKQFTADFYPKPVKKQCYTSVHDVPSYLTN